MTDHHESGQVIIENISDRLNAEVAQMIRANPNTSQDIRTYIRDRGQQLAADISVDKEGQLVYDFRTANGTVSRSVSAVEVRPTLPSPVGADVRVSDYRASP